MGRGHFSLDVEADVAKQQRPDLGVIKGRQQQTWASGDYAAVGTRILIMSELLCEAVDLRAGQRVLDVATGSGNAALAAARRWGEVTGVDYVPALLERARVRAHAEGLPAIFQEGDAEQLPFPDASFDVVLSVVGAMFAPDQERVAQELLRVCRPGGKIGMANWTPDGFVGELFRVMGRHVPLPPGLKSPSLWGTEERLRELFGDGVASLQVTRRSFTMRFRSADHFVEFFRAYYGPTLKAFESLEPTAQEALTRDLVDLVGRFNVSDDETMVWPQDYVEVVAVRR